MHRLSLCLQTRSGNYYNTDCSSKYKSLNTNQNKSRNDNVALTSQSKFCKIVQRSCRKFLICKHTQSGKNLYQSLSPNCVLYTVCTIYTVYTLRIYGETRNPGVATRIISDSEQHQMPFATLLILLEYLDSSMAVCSRTFSTTMEQFINFGNATLQCRVFVEGNLCPIKSF